LRDIVGDPSCLDSLANLVVGHRLNGGELLVGH
jgi:hypothetical protein